MRSRCFLESVMRMAEDKPATVLVRRFGDLTPPELVVLQKQYDRCEQESVLKMDLMLQ